MKKASLRRGRWRDRSVLGFCWINNTHCPPLFLLSLSLFGVLVAFVATGGIVAVWRHCPHLCHCHRHCCCTLFAPITIALATVVITLAASAAWFLLSSLPFGVIIAIITIAAIVAITAVVAVVTVIAVALFSPVAIALAAVIIALAVVTTTGVPAIAAALVPS
jgi:hypothetical protein